MPPGVRDWVAAFDVRFREHFSHCSLCGQRLLRQPAAVVTMAGYNSLCEVLAWRKKALVVPRAGPSAEQRIRSQVFSQ